MANIVYRGATTPSTNAATQNKGVPLTNTEIDGNFLGLQNEILTKAPSASPSLTGTPIAPTASAGTNTTQIATTEFVISERSSSATLTNKTLTNPTINAGSGVVVLPASSAPAQTAEGSVVWDSDDDLLTVGTGAGRKTIADTDSSQALTNKTVNRITITTPANGSTLTIADGKTFTLNNTLSFSGTDTSSVSFGSGGTVAYQGGTLAQFASTTSAQLAGIIADETGSGALVFATSPTLTTPIINTSMRVPVVYGSNAASASLTLSSTSSATKGSLLLGETGDTVRLNTTTNGVLISTNSNGTFSVDTTVYYKTAGADVAIADGGTGLSTAPGSGQILIGTSSNTYSLGSIGSGTGISVSNTSGAITVSNVGVTSLAGTNNRVSVNASTGAVTISGPQDIHSGATPSFVQVNLSSSPTSNGHAATKLYVDNSIGNGTLTLNVSGVGLSGSSSFTANQSSAATFTVTSNATSANTASTIVARDASGNFSAGTITASLSGTATNSTTVSGLAVHAGTNNEPNKVVRTDASGYIHAGYIHSTSGNEGNNSNPSRVWGTNGSDSYLRTYLTSALSVNYAASAGGVAWTNVSGRPTAVSAFTNDSGYITSSASISGSAGSIVGQANSATITATSSNTANQIVLRDANGDFTAGVITATDFNSTSDARLKENIVALDGIELIKDMIPVQFNWKNNGKKSYGLIAQELEQILPELVIEREDGMKGVSYIPIIAMLVDAVKILDARVKELETK